MRVFAILLWFCFVTAIFNYKAYEIEQFNASVRLLINNGNTEIRHFDSKGLPISESPKLGSFVSPFYVVHYGLDYSGGLKNNGIHWQADPALLYWNVKASIDNLDDRIRKFKNMANWIIDNISYETGVAHLMYGFDWPYKNYPTGVLKAPWWSGLTDGYAIILMLRAYDYFADQRYLNVAEDLYKSVLTDIADGGSMSELNGCAWIEEYVDPRFDAHEMSYVFNGMVYATYGVEAYETYTGIEDRKARDLYECIEVGLKNFDIKNWSTYDAIGNSANVKYHMINYALLNDLLIRKKIESTQFSQTVYLSWSNGAKNSGLFYMLKGPLSYAYWHFLLSYMVLVLIPIGLFIAVQIRRKFLRRKELDFK